MSFRSALPAVRGVLSSSYPSACRASTSSLSAAVPRVQQIRQYKTQYTSHQTGIERKEDEEDEEDEDEEDDEEEEAEAAAMFGKQIPTSGHLKLNRHREVLKYFRLAVHDFPHLAQFKQEYIPPKPESESILRFRSIHYQGDAKPVTRKSVLTVDVKDLFESSQFKGASNTVKRKFLHLCGTHWILNVDGKESDRAQEVYRVDGNYSNVPAPTIGTVKISCERFPFEAQNLKWCSDRLDMLLAEAKSAADKDAEGIANLPLDLRPAQARRAKKRHSYKARASIADWPAEWKTPKGAGAGAGAGSTGTSVGASVGASATPTSTTRPQSKSP